MVIDITERQRLEERNQLLVREQEAQAGQCTQGRVFWRLCPTKVAHALTSIPGWA